MQEGFKSDLSLHVSSCRDVSAWLVEGHHHLGVSGHGVIKTSKGDWQLFSHDHHINAHMNLGFASKMNL